MGGSGKSPFHDLSDRIATLPDASRRRLNECPDSLANLVVPHEDVATAFDRHKLGRGMSLSIGDHGAAPRVGAETPRRPLRSAILSRSATDRPRCALSPSAPVNSELRLRPPCPRSTEAQLAATGGTPSMDDHGRAKGDYGERTDRAAARPQRMRSRRRRQKRATQRRDPKAGPIQGPRGGSRATRPAS